MENNRKFGFGILVAPILPAVVLSIGAMGSYANVSSAISYTILFYPPCLLATALAGLPPLYLLKRFGLVRWWSASICGFIGGAVLYQAPHGFRILALKVLRSNLAEPLLFASLGAATAFLVWLFWKFSGA